MTKRKFRNLPILALAALGAAALASPAAAQVVSSTCGITGSTASFSTYYDPFNPNPVSGATVQETIYRNINTQSEKTQKVDFYFKEPTNAPAFQIQYNGSNVLYQCDNSGACSGAPTLDATSGPSGTVGILFGSANEPDSQTLSFTITVPPNLNVTTSQDYPFSIVFVCKGTGGENNVDTPTDATGGILFHFNVLSALQLSYKGPASFAFGELGTVTTAQAPSHTITGTFHVASTGPYQVQLASGATNPYRMTYPGGSTSTAGKYIPYSVTMIGYTADDATAYPIVTCQTATITPGQDISLTATLEDGGVGKAVAPNYQDTLTVTVTPLISGTTQACS